MTLSKYEATNDIQHFFERFMWVSRLENIHIDRNKYRLFM